MTSQEQEELRLRLMSARHPEGGRGREILLCMNGQHHAALSEWGFAQLPLTLDEVALDVGCGGGANLLRLLHYCPQGTVTGIDNSALSVEVSSETCAGKIAEGRCSVLMGDANRLPFDDETFSLVTAFETVYFWQDISQAFEEVLRVLRPGGRFFICNEDDGSDPRTIAEAACIEGMTLYTPQRLAALLLAAGFIRVKVRKPDPGALLDAPGGAGDPWHRWVCLTAQKKTRAASRVAA